jgi:hypothetical protein
MMKAFRLLLMMLIGYISLSAQDSNLVTIKTGYRVSDVLKASDIYTYPQFTNAKVFFRDGSKGVAKMNYSRLFDQILYIDPKGDTLALADEKTIKFIVLNTDTFYYDEGYVRLTGGNRDARLGEKEIWVVADIQKIGTHNKAKPSVAIYSFDTYTNGTDAAKSKDLILNEDILLRKETHYYLGNDYNHFVRATKKQLMLLFPKNQNSIETYLKENKVDFDKKEDLEKLVRFLGHHQ